MYVCQLSESVQSAIREILIEQGVDAESIERAMASKVTDIEEVFEYVKEDRG